MGFPRSSEAQASFRSITCQARVSQCGFWAEKCGARRVDCGKKVNMWVMEWERWGKAMTWVEEGGGETVPGVNGLVPVPFLNVTCRHLVEI